ncbi:hypothetical protein SAMN03159338_1543 [Sphingomonas sp. NFR04]|uniref:hypothetical protein n=1 Tax=Sphingomonas sp. NFR04 TaxID=1566283 RepID=UPI0008E1E90C|nr:hypothetical protein [Sphingomonas sp. NFR04]SFJ49028.1 hypothetical protein SAMN03159338_1543 [Sphingomonas sp. NFR04]
MSKHFALGHGSTVTVWASETKVDERGRHFDCLNGAWSGVFKDGLVYVEGASKGLPGTIVWEGCVPPGIGDYNAVIPWIAAQILGRESKLYGEPHPDAQTWFWREIDGGSAGAIRGSTEMEALDRLREAFPEAGAIEWQRRLPAAGIVIDPVIEDEVAF